MLYPLVIACLLAIAVIVSALCAVGLLASKDPFQRLQFCTPVASVAMPIVALAVWIGDPSWQARIKVTLIVLLLLLTNAVLTHATARAILIRRHGAWPKNRTELKAASRAAPPPSASTERPKP